MNKLPENLKELSTKRLLIFKKKHYPSENYPYRVPDYVFDCGCPECFRIKNYIKIYKENYQKIKSELSFRENLKKV